MGEVGNFLFGGSSSKQKGVNQYESSQNSTNQSSSSGVQASASGSSNVQKSGNAGYNQAYAPISKALTPALGYVTNAGDMMGALLGLPSNSFQYNQTPYAPPSNLLPNGSAPKVNLPDLAAIANSLKTVTPSAPPPAAPPPAPTPAPRPTGGGSSGGNIDMGLHHLLMDRREAGGPVAPGQPYLVGEKRPEVFVPNTPGVVLPSSGRFDHYKDNRMNTSGMAATSTMPLDGMNRHMQRRLGGLASGLPTPTNGNTGIVPPAAPAAPAATPPNPTSALNTFADSAGMNFLLDQGTKAIAGASGANGTFNSGATGKALEQYGQNLGKTYLQDYMNQLGQYAQLGLGAGSALANAGGVNVGQSYGAGSSSSVSGGVNSSQSSGQSTGTSSGGGYTTGKSSSKKGLF